MKQYTAKLRLESGQSTVEYLMLAVMISVALYFLGVMDQTRALLFATPLADMLQILKLPV
ncbi:MAG: hypothetical protein A2X86_20175 [Bdellovibrionales bacterium GWA2_49_15]|nr:MAG: hypothetical protein A2X86_20175 [Bdellovibrionales bacterium GWA2_49_15]HAZ11370.1 hypothetical protein [Bdellovibrionales bacterium]